MIDGKFQEQDGTFISSLTAWKSVYLATETLLQNVD